MSLSVCVFVAMSIGVCVSVVTCSGATMVVKERLLRVPDTTTLTELLRNIKPDSPACTAAVAAKCSRNPSSGWIDADLDADIGLLVSDFGCKYIRFIVAVPETEVRDKTRTGPDQRTGLRTSPYGLIGIKCGLAGPR